MTTNDTTDLSTQHVTDVLTQQDNDLSRQQVNTGAIEQYVTRRGMAALLSTPSETVKESRLRGYCEEEGSNEYFEAIDGEKGKEYPVSSVEKFRTALEWPPKVFFKKIREVGITGAIMPLLPTELSSDVSIKPAAVSRQQSNDLLSQHLINTVAQMVAARLVPASDDILLLANQVRAKLNGPIPKSLKPVAKSPVRWSNNQVNEHIAVWRQQVNE